MPRDKSIALFDLDGTISRKDTYLAFLLHCLARRWRRWPHSLLLPAAVLSWKLKLKDNSWLKERFLDAILGGLDRAALAIRIDEFLTRIMADGLNPGALAALERHRSNGDRLVLASASFDFYVEPLGERLGIDTIICTRGHWDGDTLRGRLGTKNCYGHEKLERIRAVLGESGAGVVAYSDHHSDLPLLLWAENGVAVNPTRKLRVLAAEKRLPILDWRRSPSG